MGFKGYETMEGKGMSRVLRFPCTIINGQMTLTDRESFDANIKGLDGSYYLELKETTVRSPIQNNYYWTIVEIIRNDLGYTKQEMHEAIKEYFEIESTKYLTKSEFAILIDDIIIWAGSEMGITIPS